MEHVAFLTPALLYLGAVVGIMLLLVVLSRNLLESRLGRSLRAIHDSEIAAQSSIIAAKLRERNAVVERFEEHRRRYVELTAGGKADAREAVPERR